MDMTGEYRIPAPRETVWAALNDTETLKRAIPGCESIERQSETEMTATVMAKVGPVKARFTGAVTLENLNPPESYTIRGEGKGGAAGFAKGGAQVSLREDGEVTVLTYTAHADVGGKLAQLGSRLIQGTARKLADEFFGNFSREVAAAQPQARAEPAEAEPAPTGAPAAAPVEAVPSPPRAAAPPPPPRPAPVEEEAGWLSRPWVWIAIVVVVLLLLILLLR
jgi:uncharacterized protein